MALDPEEIASALELNMKTDKAVVILIKERIEKQLGELGLNSFQMSSAEWTATTQLDTWRLNAQMRGTAMPASVDGWCDVVDQCMSEAKVRLAREFKFTAEGRESNLAAFHGQKERQQKEVERMDSEAEQLGLPKVEELTDERSPHIVGSAGMDKVVAARLGEQEGLITSSLSSCTGVSLFDPQTKVGAIMHVYDGKVTIQDALKAMEKVDPSIEPGRLQVTLMPGTTGGVNSSHLESLHDQLSDAGISKVRDFSKEGRKSPDLLLKGDGMVLAAMSREERGIETHGPKAETSSKKVTVGEVLGMGKYSSTQKPEGLGTDVSSTGNRLKRSNSEPTLRVNKHW